MSTSQISNPNIHSFNAPGSLGEQCWKKIAEDPIAIWPESKKLSEVLIRPHSFTPIMDTTGATLTRADFPLKAELINQLTQSSSAFIVFEDSPRIFSKSAFLKALEFAGRGSLTFDDFYGKIPPIIKRMIGNQVRVDDHPQDQQLEKQLVKKWTDYLTTLEPSRLMYLAQALPSSSIMSLFPHSALPFILECDPGEVESQIKQRIANWIFEDTPGLTTAQKLALVKAKGMPRFSLINNKIGDLDISLSNWNESSWTVRIYGNTAPDFFKRLSKVPIETLECHFLNDKSIQFLSVEKLKTVKVAGPLTIEAMKHLAKAPIEVLEMESNQLTNEWFAYIPKTV